VFRVNLSRWIGGCSAPVCAAVVLLLTHPALGAAQCIMCYLSATASGERGSQVLRMGIIVLAVPTLLTFAGVFLLAYRRRNPVEWSAAPSDEGSNELPDKLPNDIKEELHPASRGESESFLPIPADHQSQSPSMF